MNRAALQPKGNVEGVNAGELFPWSQYSIVR